MLNDRHTQCRYHDAASSSPNLLLVAAPVWNCYPSS